MNRFKITITDLETGNVEVDEETNCIIGAVITDGSGKTRRIGMVNCNAFGLACTIAGARDVIAKFFSKFPGLEYSVNLRELKKTLDEMKGDNEQNGDA